MLRKLSSLIDKLSGFFAAKKGLLPIIGLLLIVLNFIFRFFPINFYTQTDFFLHLGLIIVILGFMLGWAL